MNKKLISILAILALVTGSVFAVQTVVNDGAAPYTDAFSTTTADESATVVADAASIPFQFALQASSGINGSWVNAAGKDVYDADNFNVRTGFTANFRILTTAGSQHTQQSFKITVSVGALTHIDGTSTGGAATISGDVSNSNYTGSFDTNTNKFTLTTKDDHTYSGVNEDAVKFDVTYAAAANAIAGRYESTVTVAYDTV